MSATIAITPAPGGSVVGTTVVATVAYRAALLPGTGYRGISAATTTTTLLVEPATPPPPVVGAERLNQLTVTGTIAP